MKTINMQISLPLCSKGITGVFSLPLTSIFFPMVFSLLCFTAFFISPVWAEPGGAAILWSADNSQTEAQIPAQKQTPQQLPAQTQAENQTLDQTQVQARTQGQTSGQAQDQAQTQIKQNVTFKRQLALLKPIVVLTTDFDLDNEAVGLCHGAILSIDPTISIVDLCHKIKPFNIRQAGLALKRTECFPKGSVFVTVVDPGVGTDRGSVAIKTRKGLFYVAPNNGIVTEVVEQQGLENAVMLDPLRVNPDWKKGTFDGRDLFSPAGAILASNRGDLTAVGHAIPASEVVLLPTLKPQLAVSEGSLTGHYIKNDHPYGNAWTDITEKDLAEIGIKMGDSLFLEFDKEHLTIPFVTSFGNVPEGNLLAYLNSDTSLAFALNMGDFVDRYKWTEGREFRVSRVSRK
ncbi:MAG: SAM-dependent chlorinase/fluorinase [Candidatus Ozemobacteraceae bacterium]